MLHPHHVKAPRADGSILMQPPLQDAPQRLAQNLARWNAWDDDLQGRRVSYLREHARSEILEAACKYLQSAGLESSVDPSTTAPLIVTGHQPELFHPGVWIKNFAAGAIAKASRGIALNLIVDNDIPKSAGVRVPHVGDGLLRGQIVDFDAWAGEVPYEDWSVQDVETFATFGDRVKETLAGLVPDPLIDPTWPLVMQAAAFTDKVGLRFSLARRQMEARLGTENLEVPLSHVCETDAFRWFTCHILAQLPRFLVSHNEALLRYRNLYKIRSKNHPVPELDREGQWLESPFWVWRADTPRRRPLLVRQNERDMDLRIAGEDEPFGTLRLGPDREACCAVEDLREISKDGIRIRTRALTTTMFARLFLGDLFIHGIGGAKYDELGDEVIRRFYRIEPPSYLTLSMTLWLGLDVDASVETRLTAAHRLVRDLRYQPERFLKDSGDAEIQTMREAKSQLLLEQPRTRRERAVRFRRLRACTSALAEFLVPQREAIQEEIRELDRKSRENTVARGRDWSFVVHSRSRIEQAMRRVQPAVNGD